MEQVVLQAVRRNVVGKQVSALRRAGQLPAVIYGSGIEPTPISLNQRETSRLINHMPTSSLVAIELDGTRHMALIREKQRNILLGSLSHIDFLAISMTERLRVPVQIEIVGESPAVHDQMGILVTMMEQVEVECMPQDLPESIKVDISVLKEIGGVLHVSDLIVPEKVDILADPAANVIMVTAPAAEEVEEEVEEEEEEAEEPEVIERGKKEENTDE